MKTKEEILANQFEKARVITSMPFTKVPVLKSMNEYAKQTAIAFADYKKDYRWLNSVNKWTSDKDDLFTTEELFNQFIEETINKQP